MALSEIKKKYFDQGIHEHLAEDYFMVGLIMGKEPYLDKLFFAMQVDNFSIKCCYTNSLLLHGILWHLMASYAMRILFFIFFFQLGNDSLNKNVFMTKRLQQYQ